MYGTVAIAKVKPENREKLIEVMRGYRDLGVAGFRRSQVLFPENHEDACILAVWFEDRESYRRNADDPTQHERYLEYRALMEADPEWHDGEWLDLS